ncbi:MAG TPA: hypothetical protein VIY51_03815 [Xanthobacteraceae bacterium]
MRLPFWIWFIYFDVKFWFLTVPAAIILMLAGWYGANWLGGLRWAAFGAAALLTISFPIAAVIYVVAEFHSAANLARLQRTLDRDETVDGLPLPAGSTIGFRDEAHSIVVSIDLPRATDIRGLRVVGTLTWYDFSQLWSGSLAEDQRLDGWPCRAGAVEFDNQGVVQKCELAAEHELLGLTLPPGTNVSRGTDGKAWDFRLPADAGLAVPLLAATVPPGVTLSVASNGRLERIASGHGQAIVVRGVPLNSMNFYVRGDQVVAGLAEPFMVAGEMRPAETGIRIDLPTGGVSLAGKNWWLSE